MDRKKRNTLLTLGVGGLGVVAIRNFPTFFPEALVFEPMEQPSGFRKFTAGDTSSGGFDPFANLDSREDAARRTIEQVADTRIAGDVCAALYQDMRLSKDQVPIASFSDYYCPFCRVQTKRLARLAAAKKDEISVAWHELPLLGETSNLAAKAALAAKRQDAYVAFHDRLMRSAFAATPEYLSLLAIDLNIDADQMLADMYGPAVSEELENSAALARVFAFIGTPALVIGRTVIQGQVSDHTILRIVDLERQDVSSNACWVA